MEKNQGNTKTRLAAHRGPDELSQSIVKLLFLSREKELKRKILKAVSQFSVIEQVRLEHLVRLLLAFLSRISRIAGLSIDKYLCSWDENLTTDYFLDAIGIELNELYSSHFSSHFEILLTSYRRWVENGEGGE